jgi:hypothetical protein
MTDQLQNTVLVQLQGKLHSREPLQEMPQDLKEANNVLQAIDREMEFYRKRAGQVFFFGSFVEVLLLAGEKKIIAPGTPIWIQPIVYTLAFIAVVLIGILLGSEYRSRIRILKDSRQMLLHALGYKFFYPNEKSQRLSEIQVLYVVLGLLSSGGILLSWMKRLEELNEQLAKNQIGAFAHWPVWAGGITGGAGLFIFAFLAIWWRFRSQ